MNKYILVHFIISLICFGISIKDKQKALLNFIMVFTLPVLGILFLVIIKVLEKIQSDSEQELKSYQLYIKNKQQILELKKVDYVKEINVISLEEALLVSENKIKRNLLIDVFKNDYKISVKALKKALQDEDSETSHYAASGIMRLKKEFELKISEYRVEYEKNKSDKGLIKSYLILLKNYLNSDLLDQNNYNKYLKEYSHILGKVVFISDLGKEFFEDKISAEITLGNLNKAKDFCDKYYKKFPNIEGPYLMYMKLYYYLKDNNSMKYILAKLRNSNIVLTKRGLDMVRFWI